MPPKKKPNATNINFIINMKVYPFDVMVSINQTDEQLGKSLDKTGLEFSVNEVNMCRYAGDTANGRYVMFENNASLLRLRNIPECGEDFGHLAHEVFHVAATVLDRVGMKLEIMTSCEAYAYLIQYLTENIYEQINKYY